MVSGVSAGRGLAAARAWAAPTRTSQAWSCTASMARVSSGPVSRPRPPW
jgi:hypothetical protein